MAEYKLFRREALFGDCAVGDGQCFGAQVGQLCYCILLLLYAAGPSLALPLQGLSGNLVGLGGIETGP